MNLLPAFARRLPAMVAAFVACLAPPLFAVQPVNLRCEYVSNPLGVDSRAPRLFWQLGRDGRDIRQTGYEIQVAASLENLSGGKNLLWDSGRVTSDESIQIPYAGAALSSSAQVFWRVRIWDEARTASAWSKPARWTMGVLKPDDWKAKWIGQPKDSEVKTNWETVVLRRDFAINRKIKRALIHVCGLGQYELQMNGHKAGSDVLSPGWSKYDKTCLYDTLDVTSHVKKGDNAIGLLLGNGMYNVHPGRYTKFTGSFGALKAIAMLRLEYSDGSIETVGTDEAWHAAPGPITFSSVFGGEDFDARLEPRGWTQPGFDDSKWPRASEVSGPGGELKGLCCAAPPIQKFEELMPISMRRVSNNIAVYDLGQNAAIIANLKARGPAGSSIRIIPAELLKPDGTVDRRSCAHAGKPAWWQYTLAGAGLESWESRFFYHGCRYLEVETLAAAGGGKLPDVIALSGTVVQSASPNAGTFECSNNLFNRIHTLVRWAQRANMMSVLTDCPHRERLGWLEQYHLNGPSLRYEFDLARLFTKGMNDMADSQLPGGLVPDIAPEYVVFSSGFRDSPEWGSAFILVPYQQYLFDGDVQLLRGHYEEMKRYLFYLKSRSSAEIVNHGLGDWYDIGPNPPGEAQLTPKALTATAFYYRDAWVMEQTAKLLGMKSDQAEFHEMAQSIRKAFNKAFFNPQTCSYGTGSQCANAIPLVMDLAPAENREGVLQNIVADIRARGNAFTAGDVGYRYLLRALAEGGRSDVIFDMVNQSEKPGYGYQLKRGATSLTEAWDADPASSQNHFMLGQIMEWFYADLAGIAPDPAGSGFKKILMRPQPAGDVQWVKASHDSLHGTIESNWKRESGKFDWTIHIPANTSATVFVPVSKNGNVSEGGRAAVSSKGLHFLRNESHAAVFEVSSGTYHFVSGWKPE